MQRLVAEFREEVRAAVLMSGAGSNARALAAGQWQYPNVKIEALIADRIGTGVDLLGLLFGIQAITIDCRDGKLFFSRLSDALTGLQIDVLLYAGLLRIAPDWFVKRFPGINVHPADLLIRDGGGRPILTGLHCIRESVKLGYKRLACTVHVVETEVDCGEPLIVMRGWSEAVGAPTDDRVLAWHQSIKTLEHIAYPLAVGMLSRGEFRSPISPMIVTADY